MVLGERDNNETKIDADNHDLCMFSQNMEVMTLSAFCRTTMRCWLFFPLRKIYLTFSIHVVVVVVVVVVLIIPAVECHSGMDLTRFSNTQHPWLACCSCRIFHVVVPLTCGSVPSSCTIHSFCEDCFLQAVMSCSMVKI